VPADSPVRVLPMDSDPVVEVSHEFQQALDAHEAALANAAGDPFDRLGPPWEEMSRIQPLLGLTDSHAGHGTFVTGLIHQKCPDARVLSLRILYSDGFSSEGSILFALEYLRQRVETALATGNDDLLVDAVSMSLGFYPETTTTGEIRKVSDAIKALTDLGVAVVAAAGNHATTRPFLPAAFGANAAHSNGGNELLAAIGALNASGITTAAFSNDGEWITRWAPGNALVSTVPVFQGAESPSLSLRDRAGLGDRMRTGPDNDDLTSGFAVWAGTSFATPVVAGMVAQSLCDGPAPYGVGKHADRVRRAFADTDDKLRALGWR
jgi:subtilisin family serine protease